MFYFFNNFHDEYYIIEAKNRSELIETIFGFINSIHDLSDFIGDITISYFQEDDVSMSVCYSTNVINIPQSTNVINIPQSTNVINIPQSTNVINIPQSTKEFLKNDEKFIQYCEKHLVNYEEFKTKKFFFESLKSEIERLKKKNIPIKGFVYFKDTNIALFLQNCNNKEKNTIGYNFTQSKLFDKNLIGTISKYIGRNGILEH
jgi:hypothetical protein